MEATGLVCGADNALEAIAAQHCDSLLIVDELAQV